MPFRIKNGYAHPICLYSCHSIPCYKLLEAQFTVSGRVSFHTGTGNIVPRLVTDLTDFFGENKEFSMILGKNWNFKVVFD